MAFPLGRYLITKQIMLQNSANNGGLQVLNPHAIYKQQLGYAGYVQTSSGAKTVDEVKSQIDGIYNTLTSAENLPEMDPDSRLVTPLYPHQRQALYFMTRCEHPEEHEGGGLWKRRSEKWENLITGEFTSGLPNFHKGGILADDMGLGKTLEVLSLILKTFDESTGFVRSRGGEGEEGLMSTKGTLIICPLSTVQNWEEQLASHVKRGSLSVYVYHGAARCQDPRVLSKFVRFLLSLIRD